MKNNLQRRATSTASVDMPTQGSRSFAPPEPVLQASAIDATTRNGNPNDEFNDALTAEYIPHQNDPELWDDDFSKYHTNGPLINGPLFHRGEGDENEISPNDVHQGDIGNCYLMAALTGVAKQNPELIRNAIEGPLDDGTYNVHLFSTTSWDESVENSPVTINVSPSFVVFGNMDDHPLKEFGVVEKYKDKLAYASNADRDENGNMELWVSLIEKAHAQLYGGWEKVDGFQGGWPMMVLEMLTGEPYMEHYFDGVPEHLEDRERQYFTRPSSRLDAISTEELRDTIIGNLNAGKVVTAANKGHAFTVWEADEESITVRDQQSARDADEGFATYTWEEFRSNFMKFTTRRYDE